MRFDHRPPRHKAEPCPFVQHRKASAGQLNGLTIDTTDGFAIPHRPPRLSCLLLQLLPHHCQLTVPQGRQQVASEDNALPPALGQLLPDQEIHALRHRLTHLRPEPLIYWLG